MRQPEEQRPITRYRAKKLRAERAALVARVAEMDRELRAADILLASWPPSAEGTEAAER